MKNFDESMTEFFKDCQLEGSDKYDCSVWKTYTNATKSLFIKDAPMNLIINLKRFDKFGTKIKSSFEYPHSFKLSDYTSHITDKNNDVTYELYAVIKHEGRFSTRGHYNWCVKGYDNSWYVWDDKEIQKFKEAVRNFQQIHYKLFLI